MGNDDVGLVGSITNPIASAGGNIVDLRQDVLHGLFTIYFVVDLTDCDLRIEAFKELIKSIGEDTGLDLTVDNYHPIARNPKKKNILIVLVGADKPGIISSIAQTLGNYKANIEFAKNVARENIFLMELLTDVSHCSVPLENLMTAITKKMDEVGITALFQTDDVFNKKKRVILFDITHSLIPNDTIREILHQTELTSGEIKSAFPADDPTASLNRAAKLLEGLSADVITKIAKDITVDAGTIELIQTLKVMGYKICIVTDGFSIFVDSIAQNLGVIHRYGVELDVDDDSRLVSGEIAVNQIEGLSIEAIKEELAEKEQISTDDVTIISDEGFEETPGIRIELNLETILEMYNKHVINKENLIGLLGSLG
ncbi:MAG: HAD-IB family phosphatase, partial [Anaerolineales bacterium]